MANYNYVRKTFEFNGKRYQVYGKTEEEAIKKATLKQKALEDGDIGVSKNMTVARWCETWLETYKEGTITDKSYKYYQSQVNNVILPEIGNMKLKDVRDIHLQKIMKTRKGFSKSNAKKLLNTIQAIFKQARISRLITYDPAEGSLTMPKTTQGKRRSITDIERAMILKTAEEHQAGLWVKMMLYCGLRPGEIIALQWKDIDIEKKMVIINKAKESGNNEIKDPKTEAGNREVPIPDIFITDLKEAQGSPFAPFVTQTTRRKVHTETSFYKQWKSFKRSMDIANGAKVFRNEITLSTIAPDLDPYCLRHTFCTDLEDAGVSLNVASKLMGHSNIAITAKIYTHTTAKTINEAAAKMNAHYAQAS